MLAHHSKISKVQYLDVAALRATLFPLAVSPINCIGKMMDDVREKVGRMVSAEAVQGRQWTDQTKDMDIITRFSRKYSW
jgi:hypothetical protein